MKNQIKSFLLILAITLLGFNIQSDCNKPDRYDDEYEFWQDSEDAFDYDDNTANREIIIGSIIVSGPARRKLTCAAIENCRHESWKQRWDTRTKQRQNRRAKHYKRMQNQLTEELDEYY